MSEASDETLRRAFARAPEVAADETFVASVAVQVGVQRTRRRALQVVRNWALVMAGLGLAVWLAPVAPSVRRFSDAGSVLMDVPDRVAAVAQGGAGLMAEPWLLLSIAVVLLPLAGVAWLLRRG
jgi:hypothetical protein